MYFDLIIIGSGPGLENVCLNWGCIPLFTALVKAKLNDSTDGFIIDDNSGELLGCQVARKLETTSFDKCIHPTISEYVVEAITL